MDTRKMFKRADAWLFGALALAALLAFGARTLWHGGAAKLYAGALYAEITVDGQAVQTIDLSEGDTTFALPERPAIHFELRGHAIAFTESDCPDKVCVHAGFLSHAGQSAACLPNRVSVRVFAKGGADDVDAVIH